MRIEKLSTNGLFVVWKIGDIIKTIKIHIYKISDGMIIGQEICFGMKCFSKIF